TFATAPTARPEQLHQLKWSLRRPRTFKSSFLSMLCGVLSLLAAVPLFSVLLMLIVRGGARLRPALFTQLPPAAGMVGGGIGNALVGTLLVMLIAALLSIPVGVLGGVYLAEINPEGRAASALRFCAKLLAGLPSILAGVFAYATVVLATGRFSPL